MKGFTPFHEAWERLWWFLTRWMAPFGPVLISSRREKFPDGHEYAFVGLAWAVRRKKTDGRETEDFDAF